MKSNRLAVSCGLDTNQGIVSQIEFKTIYRAKPAKLAKAPPIPPFFYRNLPWRPLRSLRETQSYSVFRSFQNFKYFWLVLGTLLAGISFQPERAFGQAPYQGKVITLIQGREAGGSGDLQARAVIPYLQKYIPGNPTVVTEFMPGAGGRKAVNYIYSSARPDGFTIGNIGGGMVVNAVLGESGVQYDLDKLIYLGASDTAIVWVFLTTRDAGLSSLEKLRGAGGVRVGAQSVGHIIYTCGRVFAYMLGMKDPKFITGYSGPELDVALMRGEVDARANIAETILKRSPEYLERGLVNFHPALEAPKGQKVSAFAHLPELESFTRVEKERKVLEMFRSFRLAGSPYILPPGTPRERVEILREAMRKTFQDPDFHREFKKLTGSDPSPVTPEALEKIIREIPKDPETVDFFKKLAGSGPLPER